MYWTKKEPSIPDKIKENIGYEKQLELEIKMKQKYLQAIKQQTLGYIHGLEVGSYFSRDTLHKSWLYFGNKNKKEATKEHKDAYKYVKHLIDRMFEGFDHKIKEIIMQGYSQYAYDIIVKVSYEGIKREIEICIPILTAINSDESREYTDNGKYIIRNVKGCSHEWIDSTYDFDEINDIISEFLEKEVANE